MKALKKWWLLAILLCVCNKTIFAQLNITRVEYYVNTDPGYGMGTAIPITPANNLPSLSFNLNISGLPVGLSIVGVRSRDADGAWSHDNRWLIAKLPTQGTASNIIRVEYYVNTDPGYGNGTPVNITPAGSDGSGTFTLDISGWPIGLTMVGVRSMDARSSWSHDNRWLIAKLPPHNVNRPVKRVEYYIDNDPGYGNGNPIATERAVNLPARQIHVNISGLAAGKHYIFYRTQDVLGAWSHDNVDSFTLASSRAVPVLTVNSVSKNTLCSGDSVIVGYHATGTYASGNVFRVFLSDAIGSFVNEIEIGNSINMNSGLVTARLPTHLPDGVGYKLRIKSSNPALTGETGGHTLVIYDRPAAQTITGLTSVNGSETWPYIVTPATGSTWNWIITNGIKSGGGTTNNITIQWAAGESNAVKAAQIKVLETNQYGCVSDTGIKLVNIYKLRIRNMLSSTTPCVKDSVTVTVNTDGVFYATPVANQFIAELSNAAGSFTTPVATANFTSGAVTGNNQAAAILKIGIPANLPNGINYRVRVSSTNPVFIGDTSAAISIQEPDIGQDTTLYHVCAGETTNLNLLYNTTGLTAIWNTVNPVAAPPGTYRLIVTNTAGCADTAFASVILEVAVWNGSVSNNWHTAANWSANKVPGLRTHVIIPAGTPNTCTLNAADGEVASVQVKSGANLQVAANRKLGVVQKCFLLPTN